MGLLPLSPPYRVHTVGRGLLLLCISTTWAMSRLNLQTPEIGAWSVIEFFLRRTVVCVFITCSIFSLPAIYVLIFKIDELFCRAGGLLF